MSDQVSTAPSTPSSTPTSSSSLPTQASSSNANQQANVGNSNAGSSPSSTAAETFEVKVNGKSVKMTREELIANASMSHAAQQRFEEAARTRKQVDRIINTAKNNPIQALMDPELGLSKDQIRDAFEKWYTQEFIEPETLTPEQKRAKDMERELERYRQSEKEALEKARREQEDKLTATQRDYLQKQIIDAMEKSGLPKTKFFAQRMAFYMRENLKRGWEAPIELIASQVNKERQEMLSDLVESADYATLKKVFGEGMINKLHRGSLEEIRTKRGQAQAQSTQGTSSDGYGNRERVYSSDVTKRLREMRMGK
jgi:small-conductance mechanosensitive channel